jgi:curli biogenesis system outer membrane secretion channel CsgG
MRITPLTALIFPALLAACASEISNPLTGGFFADPGLYEFHSCEQIAAIRTGLKARQQELTQLIERAEKGTGGVFVSAIAYKGDYRAVQEQLQVIDATARDKKCKSPEN